MVNQFELFDDLPVDKKEWEKEWQDMPEFIQKDLSSHRKIVLHFRNDEDVRAFAKLINQPISPKQPTI